MEIVESRPARLARSSPMASITGGMLASVLIVAGCAGGGLGSAASPAVWPTAPTPIVIETDMSWDDITALVYLLKLPSVEVTAIGLAGDGLTHCVPGVTHVRELVAYLGHAPVPVACGHAQPLSGSAAFPTSWRQNADAFFGLKLPEVPPEQSSDTARQVLGRAILASPKTVVISLAPMTDLAALMSQPDIRGRIQMIYAMAGALEVPGNEPEHALAEWNVYIDPQAAQQVLQSGVPITLVPLDATDDVPVMTLFQHALNGGRREAASDVIGKLLSDPYYYSGSQYFWDPVAAMVAIDSGLARFTTEWITVVQGSGADQGRTIQSSGGVATRVAVSVNAARFYRQYLRVVTGDSNAAVASPKSRLEVSYSGSQWVVHAAVQAAAKPMALDVTNDSSLDVGVVVAKLASGHVVTEVDNAILAGITSPPPWFQVLLQVTVPKGHPATWGVDLEAGTYVVVGGGPNVPLRRLAAVQVP